MKKISVFFLLVLSCASAVAQHSGRKIKPVVAPQPAGGQFANRTTAIGDTFTLSHVLSSDTLTLYSWGPGKGYTTGTDSFNDLGFAERYDINGADSSVRVIGVMAIFGGVVNPASANSVNFHVWNIGEPTAITATMAIGGTPTFALDTLTVPFTHLGIGATTDTLKTFLFDSATALLSFPFFVGYDMNYSFGTLNGDTIGLMCTLDGERNTPAYYAYMAVDDFGDTTRDTVINVQNATQWSDYNWHDNYTDNDSIFDHLAIYPIVAIENPTSVASVSRNSLTLFNAFPNPATNCTNIHFSLTRPGAVSIQLMDMRGAVVTNIQPGKLTAGEHTVPVDVSKLPAGNYIYLIRTYSGDGLAGKLTVGR